MWLRLDPYEAEKEDSMDGDEFFDMITGLINVSKDLRVPIERWKTVHNLFIRKDPNNFNIGRLRPLHKIEAELNLIRREIITQRLLKQAEQHQYLDDNSYGGCNGRSAMDAVIKKFFTLQTMHIARHNGVPTDCDAKSCYDRVIPLVPYLSYGKTGLPHETCIWLCQSLTQMKYHVTTTHGISNATNQSNAKRKLYGVGQGATGAPTGWLFVSMVISQLQDELGTGCTLQDPATLMTVTWTHVIFVDDAYLMHNLKDLTATPSQIAEDVEKCLSFWNNGIHTTGGRLESTKTKHYILCWKFLPNGEPWLETSTSNGGDVYLDAGEGPVLLQRY